MKQLHRKKAKRVESQVRYHYFMKEIPVMLRHIGWQQRKKKARMHA